MTEEKLIEFIRKTIIETINEQMLGEMSLPRSTYKERIRVLTNKILENWILVRYCTLVGQTRYKKHWSDELYGHMITVSRWKLKKTDKIEIREKIFREIWDEEDFNDVQCLRMAISRKFMNEKIDINSENVLQCITDCIDNTNNLIHVILQRDIDGIVSYIKSI
ncbi:MAG: hypothetical protein ACI30H_02435 [Paludibacteraceae bacterium]